MEEKNDKTCIIYGNCYKRTITISIQYFFCDFCCHLILFIGFIPVLKRFNLFFLTGD